MEICSACSCGDVETIAGTTLRSFPASCRAPREVVRDAFPVGVPPARRKLLDQLGVDWTIKPRPSRETRMKELEAFFERHGHCNVSVSENRPLARWVTSLRYRKNELPAALRQKLEKMGIDWSRPASLWNRRYEEALAFKKQCGQLHIPNRGKENKAPSIWLKAQGKRWERLTAEQKQRLIALAPSICPTALGIF